MGTTNLVINRVERALMERGYDNDDVYWMVLRHYAILEELSAWASDMLDAYTDLDDDDKNADMYGTIENLIEGIENMKDRFAREVERLEYKH